MGALDVILIPSLRLEEILADGSTLSNPAADSRRLFLGEDGILHLKDSSGTVTDIGATVASLDDVGDVNAPSPSNGDVLTWDSTPGEWVAAAPTGGAGGGLVLLEQHTASAQATVDFTTFLSSTYDEYVFEFINVRPATDNVNFYMRMGTGGGPTYDTGNNYAYGAFRWSNSGNAQTGGTSGQAFIALDGMGAIDNGASSGLNGQVRLFDPQSASLSKRVSGQTAFTDNAGAPVGAVINGQYLSATAVTAIRFQTSSGDITSGTIRVYGLEK